MICWGNNVSGQAAAPPDRKFVSVAAGRSHTCGIDTRQEVVCWGWNGRGRPKRRMGGSSPSRPGAITRAPSGPTGPSPAGAPTMQVRPIPRRASSPRSRPANGIRAGSAAPTEPWPAGATVNTAKPTRHRDGSSPSQPETGTRAVCAPMASASAGAPTTRRKARLPPIGSAPSPPAGSTLVESLPTVRWCAGDTTTTAGRALHRGGSAPSPWGTGIRAGCIPAAPSPAGVGSRPMGATRLSRWYRRPPR